MHPAFRSCLVLSLCVACSSSSNDGGSAGAGAAANVGGGGSSSGVAGTASGGSGQAGTSNASGGNAGNVSGVAGAGGSLAGASSTGGAAGAVGGATSTGGAGGQGGTVSGGGQGGQPGSAGSAGTGGSGSGGGGGSGGSTHVPSYFIGADITSAQAEEANGATFSDGTKKDIFQLLKDHGFNYIRLRTFVDPKAADGYDKTNGFADLAHTITFGKRIKAAGLGFLLDFHYSDNWADPGKQCVPVAWQSYTTIDQLATAVHDYTKNAITQLIAGGARPDMVQIGNEITPGMLLHVCDSSGQPTGSNKVTGAVGNWSNLGALLKAGVKGVKDVDTNIEIMLHIDRCGDKGGYTGGSLGVSDSFISNAQTQGVAFDVFGESCYQTYQGDPNSTANTKTDWTKTLGGLVTKYPNLKFVAAEYGPMEREINDVVFGLANQQGLGTFNWAPNDQGDWNTGHALFTVSGKAYTATADLSLYDAMKTAYASRL